MDTTPPTDTTATNPDPRWLRVYLNDHLLGASAGAELARRIARNHRDTPDGPELARIADEIAADRETLLQLMSEHGVKPRPWVGPAGWLAEKATRLKGNGRLFNRSPLSSLIELESMRLGVDGKAALWRSLRAANPGPEGQRFDELIDRASRQSEALERMRVKVAGGVLAP